MQLLKSFQNGVSAPSGRRFLGMQAPHPALSKRVDPRQAIQIDVAPGDTLRLHGLDHAKHVEIVAFDGQGQCGLSSLNLKSTGHARLHAFAAAPFLRWIAQHGGTTAPPPCCTLTSQEPMLILSASAAITVWIINPTDAEAHVAAQGTGSLRVDHQPASAPNQLLPPPLGEIREEFTIPRATAQAYRVKKGEFVQIIDVDGQQCSDFMAFRTAGLDRGVEQRIDSTVTRSLVGGAYPGPGLFDKFYDGDMRPLLNVVQDTCGRHDTFALACTARGYEERGFPGHVNCSDNIAAAMDPYGVARRTAWPAINFFFNSWIDHGDNLIRSEESWSRPGDYVAMQAMDDLVCVSTACPDDVDPINGWNPTDIHVRIYAPDAPIRRAVAHFEKEDALMSLAHESAFYPRTSQLTQQFAPARNLWLPTHYPGLGTVGEYWACREKVTLQDMSSLRKYDVLGPDAEQLLQHVMTRDIAKLAQWRGTYALMCDAQGTLIDDGTLFRLGPQSFRWCCGTEESARHLIACAEGMDVRILDMQSALPNLALQGPRARDVLQKLVFTQPHVPALEDVRWFGVTVARLNDREGAPFMLARSGYTGELGYEIFCDAGDAIAIWDALMAAGEEYGIAPMGGDALEIIRIEAGLAAAGAEFGADVDAFEAGLGFAVDLQKANFLGKAALVRNVENPRRVLKGMKIASNDVPAHGAQVYQNERVVGVVTSATRSPTLDCAIAMVRLAVEHSETGTALEIGQMGGHMKRLDGVVCDVPFVDPQRKRARA